MPRFQLLINREARLLSIARDQLADVGSASLGEWCEYYNALHLRRRLTIAEAATIAPVCDIRGTAEFAERVRLIRPFLPEPLRQLPDEAMQ